MLAYIRQREFGHVQVTNEDGEQRWKRVEVRVEDHVNVPVFPAGMSPEFYDKCLDDYLSKIAMENLPQSRPLWESHIIKYPTSHAAGNVIFKFHHSLGDGFSLMGALLSCLQRADNPSLPLTFPSIQLRTNKDGQNFSMRRTLHKIFSTVYNTASDFSSNILKSCSAEDGETPIRSACWHRNNDFLSRSYQANQEQAWSGKINFFSLLRILRF
ncbi:O-ACYLTRANSFERASE (WSD1-LIKE) FAMILY PROTEIN [Salix purpurea]|uniref:diacylglycerol O-acyltransferase n=1 Tax=Salix purpurea TaxID=77065 RepID=A0A9Q0V422_SALPP|nr:O-ACYLTRANSFERASE (WSD1-LIKE) FAMILY PROTEIN [Salix purpurea]